MITLPRSPLSETVPCDPASALRLKFGAGFPTSPLESAADPGLSPCSGPPQAETASAQAQNTTQRDRQRVGDIRGLAAAGSMAMGEGG
jgi:hypothetical protein